MKQISQWFYSLYRSGLENPQYRGLVILGTLTYLLSPIDLLPDVPFVGWIDDGILLTLMCTELFRLMQRGLNSPQPTQTKTPPEDDQTVVVDVEAQEIP